MKAQRLIIGLMIFVLFGASYAQERIDQLKPIYTQVDQYGNEYHIIKTTLKDDILTLWFMVENDSNDNLDFTTINLWDVEYISEARRYPVLKDADGQWLATPFGTGEIFYGASNFRLKLEPGQKKVAWIKMQAPDEHEWPIELYVPQMLPFMIEKPN